MPQSLTINIDLDKRCAKCRKPGVVNDTGLCIECISKRAKKNGARYRAKLIRESGRGK